MGLKLRPEQNQVQVEFTGLSFVPGGKLRYQYRLESVDRDWNPPTEERSVNYANLSSGSYRFMVRAVTTDGVVSSSPAIVAFVIQSPVWQRGWFRLLALALTACLFYAVYRYRLSRLLEMERLRTRIATDLHDDVGSTLSQIAILSEVVTRRTETDDQVQRLPDIAHLSRELVDSMSDIVWAIDPEQDRFGDLAHRMRRFAGDLLTGGGVRLQFRVPEDAEDPQIGADIRRQIFLLFKESLNNAARHSGCTELQIDFSVGKSVLSLTVQDNGKGFAEGCISKGHGLSSMRRRAAQLGGSLDIDSAPGRGVTVRLRVPLTRPLIAGWKTALRKHVARIPRLRHTINLRPDDLSGSNVGNSGTQRRDSRGSVRNS